MFEATAKFKLTIGCTFWLAVASGCSSVQAPQTPANPKTPDAPHSVPIPTAIPLADKKDPNVDAEVGEPEPIHKPRPLVVAVISDLNGAYGSTDYSNTVKAAVAWICNDLKPDLVISPGDLVAGMKEGLDYPAMWASFHQVVSDPLQECGVPFVPVPGNHDAAASRKFQREREEYDRQWSARLPDVRWVDRQSWPFHFSFEIAPNDAAAARFVGLDLTLPRKLNADERSWLDTQLNSSLPTVVFGHVPIVPIAQKRQFEASADIELAQTMRGRAALFVHGHHHAFFPHRTLDVPTLSAPNLGSGSRAWAGTGEVGGPGVVVLTVEGKKVSWQAYHAPDFKPWDVHELPDSVRFDDTTVDIWRP